MTRRDHSAPYSASDIQKYLNGEMSAPEMHELERAALEDPFLADAIEGLHLHAVASPGPALDRDLSQLHESLASRIRTSRRKPGALFFLRPVPLTAAVLLVLGIGYSWYIFSSRPGAPTAPAASLARAGSQKAASASSVSSDPSSPKTPAPATASQVAADTAADNVADLTLNNSAPGETALRKRRRPRHTAPAKPLTNSDVVADTTAAFASAATTDTLVTASNKKFYTDADLVNNQLTYTGTIIDPQNHPIPGVTLAVSGSKNYAAVTDQNGQFKLSLLPADTLRQLAISSTGYDKQLLPITTLRYDGVMANIIRLNPQRDNLNEVVISGFGAHRSEAKVLAPSDIGEHLDSLWTLATPAIGREAYLQYLASAKKKLALDSTIKGPETISFLVNRKGALSSFKIEQSLSPAHDAGILQIVSDGPAWRLLKGKSARASVTITF